MILNAATPLHVIDGPILLRLGAAALLGLLLGLDRELRGHAAGLRTHGTRPGSSMVASRRASMIG